ncbi:MAG: Wzz/FepE/Etk N-terminal domain-containing protein, partial [Mucilaginibacter sp.]
MSDQTYSNKKKVITSIHGEERFDLKAFVAKIINHWPLFLGSIVIFMGIFMTYKRYSTPVYTTTAMVLVSQQTGSSGGGGAAGMMGAGALGSLTDVSSLLGIPNNANNEVRLLQSRSLITNVVTKLQLNVKVFRNATFKPIEIYKESPFTIDVHYKTDSIAKEQYDVAIENNIVHLSNTKENIDIKSKFGEPIKLDQYDLVFNRTTDPIEKKGYVVKIESKESTVEEMSSLYEAALSDKLSTTIELKLRYPHSGKGEAILHELMVLYLKADLADKVSIADSTLAFIDRELALVSTQLIGVEDQLQQFKQTHQLADVQEQSKALIGSASDYEKQLSAFEVQLL